MYELRATYLISMLLKLRGRVRSGRDVIHWFLTPLQSCCWHSEEKRKQLFFGDKIPHLESVFWKLGCVLVLRSLIRILHASLVQIDTEMTKKYSNQRYVVEMLQAPIHTQCPIQPAIRPESRFLPTHLHSTPPLGGFQSEYRYPARLVRKN